MVRRLSDDEVMDSVYKQLFGDLDSIEGKTLFDEEGKADTDTGEVANAKPESEGSGGVEITIKPLMAAAQESNRLTDKSDDEKDHLEEEEEDRLKGIGGMSPLMAQLHGSR